MFKKVNCLFLLLFCFTGVNTNAQVEKGNIIIDPYFGFPSGDFFSNIYWGDGATGSKNVGAPISGGLRIEYMLADNFGIGIDGNFAKFGYTNDEVHYEETYNEAGVLDSFKVTRHDETWVKKSRLMVRLNHHFTQTENLDTYLGFGAGYRSIERVKKVNGINNPDFWDIGIRIPISIKLFIGMRYYLSEKFGFIGEFGLGGGAIVQLGLSVKL